MAFRSIEIDDGLFKEEIEMMRDTYWKIQEQVYKTYDFGFVYLECMPFKDKALKHMSVLIELLEEYARTQFLNKMNSIQSDINSITSKLEENVTSIDEVILLLDYIELIKKPESKVEELSETIEEL